MELRRIMEWDTYWWFYATVHQTKKSLLKAQTSQVIGYALMQDCQVESCWDYLYLLHIDLFHHPAWHAFLQVKPLARPLNKIISNGYIFSVPIRLSGHRCCKTKRPPRKHQIYSKGFDLMCNKFLKVRNRKKGRIFLFAIALIWYNNENIKHPAVIIGIPLYYYQVLLAVSFVWV